MNMRDAHIVKVDSAPGLLCCQVVHVKHAPRGQPGTAIYRAPADEFMNESE